MFALTLRARGLHCRGLGVVACKRKQKAWTSFVSLPPSTEPSEKPRPFGFQAFHADRILKHVAPAYYNGAGFL